MGVKVYVSGISGNKEVKKRQQRVLMILDSRNFKYDVVDIAEPGNEEQKDFMQNNSKSMGITGSDPSPRHALPPQIFNDELYCGDYDQFDMANEIDELEVFLKLAAPEDKPKQTNGTVEKKENDDDAKTKNVDGDESAVVKEVDGDDDQKKTEEDADKLENGKTEEEGDDVDVEKKTNGDVVKEGDDTETKSDAGGEEKEDGENENVKEGDAKENDTEKDSGATDVTEKDDDDDEDKDEKEEEVDDDEEEEADDDEEEEEKSKASTTKSGNKSDRESTPGDS